MFIIRVNWLNETKTTFFYSTCGLKVPLKFLENPKQNTQISVMTCELLRTGWYKPVPSFKLLGFLLWNNLKNNGGSHFSSFSLLYFINDWHFEI